MPHLQFEINQPLADTTKIALAEQIRQLFADAMGTGSDHVSISIRTLGTHDLSLGRVREPEKGVAIVNADLRAGRASGKRRALALGFMELLNRNLGIPREHVYVTLTEHQGEDFHLVEKPLSDWREGEDPLAD